jgi:hypothetical protein
LDLDDRLLDNIDFDERLSQQIWSAVFRMGTSL